MDTNEKLNEIQFYLEIFHVLESRSISFTDKFNVEKEASFILSAILNGFFSTLEIAMDGGSKKADVKKFKISHPLFYARSDKGGLRNTTVHVKHIKPDHVGYIPPNGDSIRFNFKKTPKIVKENQESKDGINFNMGKYFYLKIGKENKRIIELMNKHYIELKQFVRSL
jgi:hypothetical protein